MAVPQLLLSIFASIFASILVIKLIFFTWTYIRPSTLQRYNRSSGAFALVTGASDGIGLSCVEELLSRDFNVILHGRNPSKLSTIVQRLQSEYPSRKIETFVSDAFDQFQGSSFAALVEKLKDLPVTILVNNVGGSPTQPSLIPLAENTAGDLDNSLNMNARFPIQITHALLPILTANQPSLIVNMSSVAAVAATPFLSIYSASKAFNLVFSSALRLEMQMLKRDIEVLAIQIGEVNTAGNRREVGFLVPSSRRFAKCVFGRVGCGHAWVWAYAPHALLGWVMELIPDRMFKDSIWERFEAERKEK